MAQESKVKHAFVSFTAGLNVPTGYQLAKVYSSGFNIQGAVHIPVYKTIKIGPVLGFDYYRKNINAAAYNRLVELSVGGSVSYGINLSEAKKISFNPALNILYVNGNDRIGLRNGYAGDPINILRENGVAVELKPSLSFGHFNVGLLYRYYKAKIKYSDDVVNVLNQYNEVHEIITIKAEDVFNFSKLNFFLGISF